MEHLLQKGIGEVMSADAFLLGNGRGRWLHNSMQGNQKGRLCEEPALEGNFGLVRPCISMWCYAKLR